MSAGNKGTESGAIQRVSRGAGAEEGQGAPGRANNTRKVPEERRGRLTGQKEGVEGVDGTGPQAP